MKKLLIFSASFAFALSGYAIVDITSETFGKTKDGDTVTAYTLSNGDSMSVKVIDFGARIIELNVPDKNGKLKNVTLALPSVSAYEGENPYFGALIGRVGNRIGGAKFLMDETEYKLNANDGVNNLHGGKEGFDKKMWKVRTQKNYNSASLIFSRVSPDGEEGFPGNLAVEVTYTLTGNNDLIFDYIAVSDADTPCNLTQHLYFNLRGAGNGDVLNHLLTIYSDKITPVDGGLIPTGEFASIAGSPFDFRKPTKIGARINDDSLQLKRGGGYDHNWVLTKPVGEDLSLCAELFEPESGRYMSVFTDQIGLQFYSGNFLDGTIKSPEGKTFVHRGGLALETQHFPDSPNQKNFPSIILKKGERYKSRTIYHFEVRK